MRLLAGRAYSTTHRSFVKKTLFPLFVFVFVSSFWSPPNSCHLFPRPRHWVTIPSPPHPPVRWSTGSNSARRARRPQTCQQHPTRHGHGTDDDVGTDDARRSGRGADNDVGSARTPESRTTLHDGDEWDRVHAVLPARHQWPKLSVRVVAIGGDAIAEAEGVKRCRGFERPVWEVSALACLARRHAPFEPTCSHTFAPGRTVRTSYSQTRRDEKTTPESWVLWSWVLGSSLGC